MSVSQYKCRHKQVHVHKKTVRSAELKINSSQTVQLKFIEMSCSLMELFSFRNQTYTHMKLTLLENLMILKKNPMILKKLMQ